MRICPTVVYIDGIFFVLWPAAKSRLMTASATFRQRPHRFFHSSPGAESLVWPPAAQAQPRPHFDPSAYPKSLGFDFMAVKLEDVFDPLADGPPGRPVLQAEAGAPETSRTLLLQMLESLKTATAKEDLLRILRWARVPTMLNVI